MPPTASICFITYLDIARKIYTTTQLIYHYLHHHTFSTSPICTNSQLPRYNGRPHLQRVQHGVTKPSTMPRTTSNTPLASRPIEIDMEQSTFPPQFAPHKSLHRHLRLSELSTVPITLILASLHIETHGPQSAMLPVMQSILQHPARSGLNLPHAPQPCHTADTRHTCMRLSSSRHVSHHRIAIIGFRSFCLRRYTTTHNITFPRHASRSVQIVVRLSWHSLRPHVPL
jgi:hypothetical protein